MEALVAVALAGNVLQFVQFSGQLISDLSSIRTTGHVKALPPLKILAENLVKQAGILQKRLEANVAGHALNEEDQSLLNLSKSCQESGKQFSDLLEELILERKSPNFILTMQTELRYQLKHAKIKAFITQLERLRNDLVLATLLALRTTGHNQHAEVISHLEALKTSNDTATENACKASDASQTVLDFFKHRTSPKLDNIGAEIHKCLAEINELKESLPQAQQKAILSWLNFRQMLWRYEEVPLAYQKTFEWILSEEHARQGWDNFQNHLVNANVAKPYFINGKAGSGKSTLMKFVVNDKRTLRLLEKWSASDDLVVLKFFFWNLGTPLQKTHVGILRYFLHTVLSRYPELIRSVFPHVYANWKDTDAQWAPTYAEVKNAFELLIKNSSGFLKLCIFVDGIDEFEGDHRDLSAFLSSLVSRQVKLVVSSRPISASLSAFQSCPTLRLQDLTKNDMDIYVKGNLVANPSMQQLTKRFPLEAGELVSTIKEKAEGVFLWVKLVVRILIEGLEDGDTISDLQIKLSRLPRDLKDLYRRMLSKMQLEHRIQASQMFQLFHSWNKLVVDQPFRTVVMSFAMAPLSQAIDMPVTPLSRDSFSWICQSTEARVRSRCCGLLEVHSKPRANHFATESSFANASDAERSVINYLHRTVAEFLISDDVWIEICLMTSNLEFDATSYLLAGCVSMMKILGDFRDPDLSVYLGNAMLFARNSSHLAASTTDQFLTAVDHTMYQHRYTEQLQEGSNGEGNPAKNGHWYADYFSSDLIPRDHLATFCQLSSMMNVAAKFGLTQYLKGFAAERARDQITRYTLALCAVDEWGLKDRTIPLHERADTLKLLFNEFCKPEDVGLGGSLWERAIWAGKMLFNTGLGYDCAELLRVFLVHSRSPRALMNKKVHDSDGRLYDPMTLVRCFKTASNPDFPVLGQELEQLAYSAEVKDVTDRFRNIITVATAQDNVSDRLRKLPLDSAPRRHYLQLLQRPQPAYDEDLAPAINSMHALQLGGKEGSTDEGGYMVDRPMTPHEPSTFSPQCTSSMYAMAPYSLYTHGPGYFHSRMGTAHMPLPIAPYIPPANPVPLNGPYYGVHHPGPVTAFNNNTHPGGHGYPGFAPSQQEEYRPPGYFGAYQASFQSQPFTGVQRASGMSFMHGQLPYGNMLYGYQPPGSETPFRSP